MKNLLLPGSLAQINIEQDISVLTWNSKAAEDYTFNSEPDDYTESCFILYYFLEPATASIILNEKKLECIASLSHCCLITNNKSSLKIAFTKGSPMQGIRIALSAEWLKDQYTNAGIFLDVNGLLSHEFSNLYSMTFEENAIVRTLFEKVEAQESILIIKAHSFSLVSYMLGHLMGDEEKASEPGSTLGIQEVEKIIVGSIKGRMPSIQKLAEYYSMSAPTLKRHFKQAYGFSIYNYYLTKKMEYAKAMLMETKCVNEVSYALGYESVSHFTAIFKKFYGYTPSTISNKTSQNYKMA
ncbi:MAG: AraC family transcriptional regulator, partial [Segetibacter sp.]